MREIYFLVKRNVWIYRRDYAAVFFSVLSMLVVLALMAVFLGDMNSSSVVDMLAQFGGRRDTAADEKNASYLIQMWTLAGILEVNVMTVTLTVMGNMVRDEAEHRLAGFYTAPVSRIKITLGYILSAWIAGTAMCMLTLGIGEIYMALCGHPLLAVADWLKLAGMIVLNAFVYASLAYLLALFVHSESAWSSVMTVIGTLAGFAGAIYLPVSMLPERAAMALKCLPVLHGAAMMRMVCTREAVVKTFDGLPETAGDTFREMMGVSVFINGREILLQYQLLFLAVCAIIAVTVSVWVSRRRKLRDR